MITILSLPNELLDQIFNDLHIDDIEAFSSCCKTVKLFAAARVEKHRARKFKFSTIAIEPRNGLVGPYDHLPNDVLDDEVLEHGKRTDLIPTSLLQDFLMDEENAMYPRLMSIRHIDEIHYGSEEKRRPLIATYLEQHHGLEGKIVAKVKQIQKSLYPENPAVEAHDWIDSIKGGNFDATAALLVTLFPNVNTLRMANHHATTENLLTSTLERLMSVAAKEGPRAFGAFTELSEINLDGLRGDERANGKLIAALMILPSMRVIKGRRIYLPSFDWPYGSATSSVNELSLWCCQMSSDSLVSCLERIRALKRFTYNMYAAGVSAITWEPRLIVKALRKHARRTLVHLELTGRLTSFSPLPIDGEPFVGTLRSFEVLESLRLITTMLFKPIDSEDTDESEEMNQVAYQDFVRPADLVEPRRLVDFLPSSARKLELVGGLSDEEARDMFADLPKLKREQLPHLLEIVLEDNDPLEQETKDLCKDAGIRLKSVKRVVHRFQRIYAVTKPTPQVDEIEL